MKKPTLMLMIAPTTMFGINLNDVSRALRCCTSWKKRLQNHSIPFKTAQESNTVIQIDEKVGLFHTELGMSAGLLYFSWRPTQNMKAGTEARDIDSKAIVDGSRI